MKTLLTITMVSLFVVLLTGCCMFGGRKGCCGSCGCGRALKSDGHGLTTAEMERIVKERRKSVTILDARTGKYDDGRRIPGAKNLGSNAPEKQINAMLPDKNAEIITYCSSTKCPASKKLAERLRKLGYTNVKEYPQGIKGWAEAKQPVAKAAKGCHCN